MTRSQQQTKSKLSVDPKIMQRDAKEIGDMLNELPNCQDDKLRNNGLQYCMYRIHSLLKLGGGY